MSYHYENHKAYVFTDEGQRNFLRVRDKANHLLKEAGAVMQENLVAGLIGLNWDHNACVDRLVELGELCEIPNTQSSAGQHRIFVRAFR